MSNENEIRIVIGSKRYAGNTDKDVWLQPPLIGDRRELIEGDRSILVNQQTLFETERQESDKFRLAGKITNVFDLRRNRRFINTRILLNAFQF